MATGLANGSGGLVGVAEAAAALGLSKSALVKRARQDDFPLPVARLECGPVWNGAQIAQYAADRCRRFEERPGVVAAARSGGSPDGVLSVPEAGRLLAVPAARVRAAIEAEPWLGVFDETGELAGVRREMLALLARAAAPRLVELR